MLSWLSSQFFPSHCAPFVMLEKADFPLGESRLKKTFLVDNDDFNRCKFASDEDVSDQLISEN